MGKYSSIPGTTCMDDERHEPIQIIAHRVYNAGFDSHRTKNSGCLWSIESTMCKWVRTRDTKNSLRARMVGKGDRQIRVVATGGAAMMVGLM